MFATKPNKIKERKIVKCTIALFQNQIKQKEATTILTQGVILSTGKELAEKEDVRLYGKRWDIDVSSQGHIIQSVKVRPGLKGSSPVAREVPWRESKMVKPSDKLYRKETMQGFRPQRIVNADVASLHVNPVAETVDHVRRQQESSEMSLTLRLSPGGYQRWHVAKDYVATGETLDTRRSKLVEEANPITLCGKWIGRYQGGGLGRSNADRGAAKRPGREGPRPMSNPFAQGEAVVR